MIRAWMQTPVNKAELASLNGTVDPIGVRRQSPQHIGRLQTLSQHVATAFVRQVMGDRCQMRGSGPTTMRSGT